MVFILIVVPIVSAAVCHRVAKRKQLNVKLWIILGSLFGPLAIQFVYRAKAREAA